MQASGSKETPDLSDTIVVGHDGSRGGEAAFALALRLAERLRATLLVVRAWTIDTAPHGTLVSDGYVASFDEASAKVARILEGDVAALVAAHPEVTFRFTAKFGQPAAVLISASPGALMLVVGSRGHGGFSSLLLGSVSEQCTRHAHCPVLVVRPSDPKAGTES
ncbi:universal stress protein [Conyzicola sp.]|uniref:universal stress protein n=1 Tax=Conyzicola sp. TaxID=1969404 RepID=UPI0039894CAB